MLTISLSTFAMISLAEIGDKSQLVCMMLASRHRALPVIIGSCAAFAVLNIIAVTLGATLAEIAPPDVMAAIVVILFTAFGFSALFSSEGTQDGLIEKNGRSIIVTSFAMIFAAEFGDKTQLAVAGIATASPPFFVYIGATLALCTTSILGALGGQWLTSKVSPRLLHKLAGSLFLGFAAWVAAVKLL